MTELETAAIQLIYARDQKAIAKAHRNACRCTEECNGSVQDGDSGVAACWRGGGDKSDWCEQCIERDELHRIVVIASKKCVSAASKLRRIVHRLDKKLASGAPL